MDNASQLGTAAAELIDAELRSLKRTALRIAIAAAIGVVVLLLALTFVGFLLTALFLALNRVMPPFASAATIAAFVLIIAMACLFTVSRMFTSRLGSDAEVAAAKAQMKEIITHFELFSFIRHRPWLAIALATAAGAMLAASTESLVGAAALVRSLTGLIHSAAAMLAKFMDDAPEPAAPVK
jgi:hypothetical protein